jgi:hypothetical protein
MVLNYLAGYVPSLFICEVCFLYIFSLNFMATKCTHFQISITFPALGKYPEVRLPSLKA